MLEAIDLSKKYGENEALANLNLTVDKGEVYCLLGQNGAGKTTTINLFLGLTSPSSGQALINGTEVDHNGATRKMIAYIPEVVQLYSNLNGVENLEFFSRLSGHKHTKNELRALLSKAGLQESAHEEKLSGYSKGMRQKVGIAIALSKNAEVIFMDEPTSGLDPVAIDELHALVRGLAAEGKTVLMVTHDVYGACQVADRIGLLQQGRLVGEFAAEDGQRISTERVHEAFAGQSAR